MLKHSVASRYGGIVDAITSAQETPTDFAEAVEDEDDPETKERRQEHLTQVGDRQDERRHHRQDDRDPQDQLEDVAVEEGLDGEIGPEQDDDREPGREDRNQTTIARTTIRSPTLTAAQASPKAR